MISEIQKQEIRLLVVRKRDELGGAAAAVARHLEVSDATISQIINGKLDAVKEPMWLNIAKQLNYALVTDGRPWQLVETLNYKVITQVLDDAKQNRLYIAITNSAGSGKSETTIYYQKMNHANGVYRIECREWGKREFLLELCKCLGRDTGSYKSVDALGQEVVSYLKQDISRSPLLIIDQANDLKPQALRFLITLYNQTKGQIGLVILGTEHLQINMLRGANRNRQGADELISRFGRRFINLPGATLSDVEAICTANGVDDKKVQREIYNGAEPKKHVWQGQQFEVVTDLRRVERAVRSEWFK